MGRDAEDLYAAAVKGRDIACVQGSDPGVSFLSEVNRDEGIVTVLASNYADNVWEAMRRIRRQLYAQNDGKGGCA